MSRKISVLLGLVLAVGATTAQAEKYPSRVITLVVPFSAGGPTDTVARMIAQPMSKTLGQTVIVENIGGAGGTIAAARVARANPDGYTIFLHHIGQATSATLYKNLTYNVLTDFEPIGLVTPVPMTIIARKDFPAKDAKEFITYVKANKDKITYGNALAEMYLTGVIDQKGKFREGLDTPRVRRGENGLEYVLVWRVESGIDKEITLTEVDIDNLIRAKGAIYAGFTTLIGEVGMTFENIDKLYIAGGFGRYIDVERAITIGMLPDMPVGKFEYLGNTSVTGAYLVLLSDKLREEAEEIAKKMTYLELSVCRPFMDEYMSALFLPHTNIDSFPTVKRLLSEVGNVKI